MNRLNLLYILFILNFNLFYFSIFTNIIYTDITYPIPLYPYNSYQSRDILLSDTNLYPEITSDHFKDQDTELKNEFVFEKDKDSSLLSYNIFNRIRYNNMYNFIYLALILSSLYYYNHRKEINFKVKSNLISLKKSLKSFVNKIGIFRN
jgi:hypothetical protein